MCEFSYALNAAGQFTEIEHQKNLADLIEHSWKQRFQELKKTKNTSIWYPVIALKGNWTQIRAHEVLFLIRDHELIIA